MNIFFDEYGGSLVIVIFGCAIIGGLLYSLGSMIGGRGVDVESVVMQWLIS